MLLGIDGGASSTKWALFSADGAVLRQGRLGSMTGHLFSPEDEAALRSRLADLADTLESRPGAVVAGISGLQGHAGPIFRAALADTFGLPERLIRVVSDLQLAYAAHFLLGEGVVKDRTDATVLLEDVVREYFQANSPVRPGFQVTWKNLGNLMVGSSVPD